MRMLSRFLDLDTPANVSNIGFWNFSLEISRGSRRFKPSYIRRFRAFVAIEPLPPKVTNRPKPTGSNNRDR